MKLGCTFFSSEASAIWAYLSKMSFSYDILLNLLEINADFKSKFSLHNWSFGVLFCDIYFFFGPHSPIVYGGPITETKLLLVLENYCFGLVRLASSSTICLMHFMLQRLYIRRLLHLNDNWRASAVS